MSSRSSSIRDKFAVGPKPSKRIKQTKTRPVQHKREKGSKPPQCESQRALTRARSGMQLRSLPDNIADACLQQRRSTLSLSAHRWR